MKAKDYAEQAQDLFVLSDSFIRIKELIDDERSGIDEIADVILIDPALSASILKLANSAIFNYPGKIDTISKAVLVLGVNEVYYLVISYFTSDAFKSVHADPQYLDRFWERSVDCALLIKFLAAHIGLKQCERLFIVGLLHNLGELVVQQFLPEKLAQCQITTIDEAIADKQNQSLGFTFSDCASELLKLWQLPYSLIEPIRYQDSDNIEQLSNDTKLLYVAKRMMMAKLLFPQQSLMQMVNAELLAELNITDEVIEQANEYCDLERFNVLSILNPSASMIF